jgi:hypothetical protein
MSESLSYCSMAWPIQPTVLPRPKSATAPPAGKASVRASVASAKSTVGRPPMSLCTTDGDKQLYALALDVENTALRLLAEHKPGRNLQTSVEFYTALLLHGLRLPTELFTPTFAIGRVDGALLRAEGAR